MSLPIAAWGLILGVCTLAALVGWIWLLLRARDVARLAASEDNDIAPGARRRPATPRSRIRAVLALSIAATTTALILFVLVATRTIGSPETRTAPNAQRP